MAIARALANEPGWCWPTSPPAISTRRPSGAVFQNLYELASATGVGVLIATHNMELAGYMHRVVALSDGRLEPR